MSKTDLEYDPDLKEQVSHVEYGLKNEVHYPVDLHDAAAAGHLATDERGKPLIEIDEVASKKLARKVRPSAPSTIARLANTVYSQIDKYIVPIVALQYLFAFIDRANIGNARLGEL